MVLLAFLLFIPYLLAFMCKAAGLVSRSQVDFKVITLFFYFQVEGMGKEAQERGHNCNLPSPAYSESLAFLPVCSLQVVVVFFYDMISGSFINQFSEIVNKPTSIISILGSSVPQTATFFVCYILTAGEWTGMLENGV